MSDFPLRRPRTAPASLAELARVAGAHLPRGGEEVEVSGVAPLASAGAGELGFLAARRYLEGLEASRAAGLLVPPDLAEAVEDDPRPLLVADDPHAALRRLLEFFHPPVAVSPEVHPTAVVAGSARLGSGVRLGPFAVVEEEAELGDGVVVGAHSVVGAGTRIGAGTLLHPHVVVYPGSEVGARVILHAGVRLGVDGFGYAWEDGGHRKVPQVGRCIVEDDVEIGANTTVDRGSIGETRVGEGTKIDNLVQLGHNVVVGRRTVLAAQVGVAGSTRIGDGVMAGGQVGIGGHLEVGSGARLAGQAGVTGDLPPGATAMGMPARSRGEFLRGVAAQGRVPDLIRRIRRLEAALEARKEEGGSTGD